MVGLLARRALGLALLVGGLTACAAAAPEGTIATTAPNGAVEWIPTVMARPDGPGPFSAVVVLPDCSRLGPGPGGAPGGREPGAGGGGSVGAGAGRVTTPRPPAGRRRARA